MHIPDNYLSPQTYAVMGLAMIPVWSVAVKRVKKEITKEKMPQIGIGAAFSFLIMMFNVPLPGGTSGHAVGGTLLAILLGPFAACIAITVALLIQALIFGDGGLLAFGANCFNMAFILPFVGYFIYKFFKDHTKSEKGEYIGIVLGSYFGINIAALFAAIEFGIQPLLFKDASGHALYSPFPLSISIPYMTIPHLLFVGVIEVVFTVSIITFIKKVSPETIYKGEKQKINPIYGLIFGLICLSPVGLLATGTAWGEWGLKDIKNVVINGKPLGYIPQGMKDGFNFTALMSNYSLKGLPDFVGYIISSVAGVAILIILFKIIGTFKKK
jgi:cobalt/nickel transport system permease protein